MIKTVITILLVVVCINQLSDSFKIDGLFKPHTFPTIASMTNPPDDPNVDYECFFEPTRTVVDLTKNFVPPVITKDGIHREKEIRLIDKWDPKYDNCVLSNKTTVRIITKNKKILDLFARAEEAGRRKWGRSS